MFAVSRHIMVKNPFMVWELEFVAHETGIWSGLDKNRNLSLLFGQPGLQFYLTEAFLNSHKLQTMTKRAMKMFDYPCPFGKGPTKYACPTWKSTELSPGYRSRFLLSPAGVKFGPKLKQQQQKQFGLTSAFPLILSTMPEVLFCTVFGHVLVLFYLDVVIDVMSVLHRYYSHNFDEALLHTHHSVHL